MHITEVPQGSSVRVRYKGDNGVLMIVEGKLSIDSEGYRVSNGENEAQFPTSSVKECWNSARGDYIVVSLF